jgi:hypothetical protein
MRVLLDEQLNHRHCLDFAYHRMASNGVTTTQQVLADLDDTDVVGQKHRRIPD